MITQLIWNIWTLMSSVPKKADKLTSLSILQCLPDTSHQRAVCADASTALTTGFRQVQLRLQSWRTATQMAPSHSTLPSHSTSCVHKSVIVPVSPPHSWPVGHFQLWKQLKQVCVWCRYSHSNATGVPVCKHVASPQLPILWDIIFQNLL